MSPDHGVMKCGWLLAHRDKHNCGCQCRLPEGHAGRHACEVIIAEREIQAAG